MSELGETAIPIPDIKEAGEKEESFLSLKYDGKQTEKVKSGETESEVTLHGYTLTLDVQKLTYDKISEIFKQANIENKLSQGDLDFLRQYKKIDVKIWSKTENIQDWYSHVNQDSISGVLLGSGLASNEKQWSLKGSSFIHTLTEKFDKKIKRRFGDDLEPVIAIVSCPGFGGTEIAAGAYDIQDVSADSYARMCDVLTKVMALPSENSVVAGHSAGGEAVLQWALQAKYPDNLPVVAFNPAQWLHRADRFKLITALNEINKGANYLKIPIAHAAQEMILRELIGLPKFGRLETEAQRAQLEMHKLEMARRAFLIKSVELSHQDRPQDTEFQIGSLPTVFGVKNDALTPLEDQLEYLDYVITDDHLKKIGLSLPELTDPEVKKQIVQELRDQLMTIVPGGHDAIFIQEHAQDIATDLIIDKLDQHLLKQMGAFRELQGTLQYLRKIGYPIPLTYVPHSEKGISSVSELLSSDDQAKRQSWAREFFNLSRTVRGLEVRGHVYEATLELHTKLLEEQEPTLTPQSLDTILYALINTNEMRESNNSIARDDRGYIDVRSATSDQKLDVLTAAYWNLAEHQMSSRDCQSIQKLLTNYAGHLVEGDSVKLNSEQRNEMLQLIDSDLTVATDPQFNQYKPTLEVNAKDIQILAQITH